MVIESENEFNSLLKNAIRMLSEYGYWEETKKNVLENKTLTNKQAMKEPNGYLQWDELDLPNLKTTPISADPSFADSSAVKLVAQFHGRSKARFYWRSVITAISVFKAKITSYSLSLD